MFVIDIFFSWFVVFLEIINKYIKEDKYNEIIININLLSILYNVANKKLIDGKNIVDNNLFASSLLIFFSFKKVDINIAL